jgi:hypothetical protein
VKSKTWQQLGALRWRRSEQDPETFFYLPTAPGPVLDPTGKPSVALTVAGDKAYLSLSAQWDPPAAVLEDLRTKLAQLNKDVQPALIRISSPPLQVSEVTLGTKTGDGFPELRTVPSSGYPPWTPTFSVELDADATEAAKAALGGEHDKLAVRFRAQLEGKAVEFWSDVGKWFDPGADRYELALAPSSATEGEERAQDR